MLLRAGGTTGLEAETGKTDQRADLEVEKDAPGPEAETVLPSLPDLERGCPRQEPTATGKEGEAGNQLEGGKQSKKMRGKKLQKGKRKISKSVILVLSLKRRKRLKLRKKRKLLPQS